MRITLLLAVAALVAIVLVVRAVGPVALRPGAAASTGDISHPPTSFGASAINVSPDVPREGKADAPKVPGPKTY